MRPSLLDPVFSPITILPGIGSSLSKLFVKILQNSTQEEPRLIDLLHLLPHSIIDRRHRSSVSQTPTGMVATFSLIIDRHQPPPPHKTNSPYRIWTHDDHTTLVLNFFRAQQNWLLNRFPPGNSIIVSGRMDWFNGQATMIHPDYILFPHESHQLPLIEPVYPTTAKLSPKLIAKATTKALEYLPPLPEWHDLALLQRENFPSYQAALSAIHHPTHMDTLSPSSPARRRLAYDELLSQQLALALIRRNNRTESGRAHPPTGRFLTPLRTHLPFQLTKGQERAFAEISSDLSHKQPTLRLIQGDVGSGKTILALLAMAQVAESDRQSAFMAPTELLARQHYFTLRPLAEPIGLKLALLTGKEKGKERRILLDALKNGDIHILIGTHALIQDQVTYHDLALVIIDEQHRFGVHQRLQLTAKGIMPDLIVMTATPIPRTLVLTTFHDMDVSKLTEKPAGRKPIKTALIGESHLNKLLQHVEQAVKRGEKLYWICPLIEDSELLDLVSSTQRYESLMPIFGTKVGLIHGKMSVQQKEAVMTEFQQGDIQILVATTVIEVGIDIPDASIMIIEHAERFGLAQLHQLRGRVGRGDHSASCCLFYKEPLSQMAKARLEIMRTTEDGFLIAEEDLRLRGEGDLLGTKQSGMPQFQLVALEKHQDLLEIARQDAQLILEKDPYLTSPRGEALRLLLHLFRKNEAIRLLRSG